MTTREFISAGELAERLGFTSRYILQLVAEGRIPCLRLGRRAIRISAADAEQFIEKHRTGA